MVENKYEDVEVDLSPLLVPDVKFAVRCETKDEAVQFITAVISQFPEKDTFLSPEYHRWDDDNYCKVDGGRAYFPDLNYVEDEAFMHGDVQYAEVNGFTLVYFKNLLVETQIIAESDMPLTMLFEV